MKYQYITLPLAVLLLSSCGTMKSVGTADNSVDMRHAQVKTNCEEVSRVYSGVQYDWCLFDSKRKNTPATLQLDPLWVNSIDLFFSAVADTLVLPYTLYQQSQHGNLTVEK